MNPTKTPDIKHEEKELLRFAKKIKKTKKPLQI
jgi:hypothetical protein